MTDGCEGALDRVGRSQVLPVLGGEVVEGEQHVAVLGQAFDRLVVLRVVDFCECIEGGLGVRPGLGHPNVLERWFGFALQTLRQPVEDVGSLVHPTALLARLGPDLGKRLPEAERTVGDREFWPYRKSAPLEIEQEFFPRLRALAHARLAHRHRADAGHDLALGLMPVTHDALVARLGLEIGISPQKVSDFHLDGLREQGMRPVAQNLSERIGEGPWLSQLDDVSVGHGVSLLWWRSGGVEHPHDTPPYPFMPSPTSAHSSSRLGGDYIYP